MGKLLYIIAVLLIIAWTIAYFGYHANEVIHTLLVIALIAILAGLVRPPAEQGKQG